VALSVLALALGVLLVLAAFSTAYQAFAAISGGAGVKWPLNINFLELMTGLLGVKLALGKDLGLNLLAEAGVLAFLLLLLNLAGSGLIYLGSKNLSRRSEEPAERLIKELEGEESRR